MKPLSLFSILLPFTKASPIQQEKRQLNGLLSSLAGTLGVDQAFDYIVLGGGTAGLTIAKRLAENTAVSVAVIEAGSVYQVADPVLAMTPVGDVAFVGMVKRKSAESGRAS
jgi:choline dehydrogenase